MTKIPAGSGLLVLLPPLKMTRPGSGTLVCGEIRPGEDAADEKRGTGNMKRGAAAIFNRILTGRCYKKNEKDAGFLWRLSMKKLLLLGAFALLSACSLAPKETYPYNISEKEWNELSVKDRARIRRDFYFYEKGTMNFVNPDLEIEGRATPTPAFDVRRSDSAAQNGR